MSNLKVPAKIELYREAKQSFEFRVRFIRDVQSKVDWNKLNTELLGLAAIRDKATESDIPVDAKKTVREVLRTVITKEWKRERSQ